VAALLLTDPVLWGGRPPALWAPHAGVGLALIAWLGRRAVAMVIGAALLAAAPAALAALSRPPGADEPGLALTAGDAVLGGLELALFWWLYHVRARGARGLADPRSAILFLTLGPGLVVGGFALARAGWLWLLSPPPVDFAGAAAAFWLGRALGLLAVAPVLLTALTPWLVRRGLTAPEVVDEQHVAHRGHADQLPLTRGDLVEAAGLAVGASVLSVVLALQQGGQGLVGWPPWGLPLLLIVWACLRQGLRVGAVVACLAAAAPLLTVMAGGGPARSPLGDRMLQGNLLAQCGIALLIAASASYLRAREARYRQVVGQTPVVLYSARIVAPGLGGGPPDAEVTLVSAASAALLGCRPEALLGEHQRWLARVHPDDQEVLLAALTQLGRQNQPVICEYRLTPPADAEAAARPPLTPARAAPRWMRDTLAPRHDAEGRLAGWDGVVVEITAQRALADDLRRTSSMLHALVTNLPTGVFFVQGPLGRPLLVNARARQLLGQREDAAAGLDHLSRVYRLFRPDGTLYPVEELPVFQALRRGVSSMRDDIVVHRPDGRKTPLVTWAAPVAFGSGPSDAAVWVLEDLTALQQAEAARRDSEVRLRAVIETMGEGLIVLDRRGALVDANPAACFLLDQPVDRLRGRTLASLDWTYLREDGSPLPPEELPSMTALRQGRPVRNCVVGLYPALEGNDQEGDPSPSRAPAPPRPTAPRWLLVSAMPLGPGPAGVVTTFADVTAYRRAQDATRSSEEKHRGLVESLPLMVVQTDRDLKLTYANPAMTQTTGYDLAEIAEPGAWGAVIHPEDRPRMEEMGREALSGKECRGEVRYRGKDQAEKVGLVFVLPRRHEGGEVFGLTALVVDVTRERRLEEELQRAQRLELIGRLASGIAHDFNNLLSVVLTLTELAHGSLPADHPVHDDLRRIAEAGEQTAGLAAQLLAFSRQRRPAARPVEVNGAARRTLELLRATLPGRVELVSALAEGDLLIQGDETQLQQVLMNLCLNARDAMPRGGRLTVATEAAGGGPGEAGWVRLSVRDDGCGIDEQTRGRIFDPFFTTKEGGAGLGLAVVQQIVESLGGRVEVASRPDQGACFDVWLPRLAAAPGRRVGAVAEKG
jgi:PAS domain S-box-containing protein